MLVTVLFAGCAGCDGSPLLGHLTSLTEWDDGIIIVATLLLFPTSMVFYGGMIVFFAARETVKAWAEKRDIKRDMQSRQAERERIQREMAKLGAPLTPEQVRIISGETVKDESE
jgi:hypothetical protein